MLIISVPKSASTNMWIAVSECAEMRNWNCKVFADEGNLGGFDSLATHWKNPGTYPEFAIRYWAEHPTELYRKHILPTEGNLRILERISAPMVVLLRDPVAVRKSFARMYDDPSVKKDGPLLRDIQRYCRTYEDHNLNGKALKLHFEVYGLQWENAVRRIVDWFGWEIKRPPRNVKDIRYTGVGERQLRKTAYESPHAG